MLGQHESAQVNENFKLLCSRSIFFMYQTFLISLGRHIFMTSLLFQDADKQIIKHLKEESRLVSAGSVKHSYPFCWRSDTPLIYKAVPSWFIRVQHMNQDLLSCNADTYWLVEFEFNNSIYFFSFFLL